MGDLMAVLVAVSLFALLLVAVVIRTVAAGRTVRLVVRSPIAVIELRIEDRPVGQALSGPVPVRSLRGSR